MGALVDGFGGKISGELIRASDWNGMLAAVEALVAGVQTAIEARLDPLEDAVESLGARVTALEGAITDLTGVAATLRGRYRRMTLTAAGCPAAQTLPVQVEERIRAVPGVTDVKVDLTFDPPWDQSRMSEAARLELGLL